MADVFNMDPKVLEGLNKSMSSLSDQAKTGTMNIEHLYNTMRELANLKSKMGADDIIQVDPGVNKQVGELVKKMNELGMSQKAFYKILKDEESLRDKSIKSVTELSKIERIALDKKRLALREEQTTRVRIGKDIINIGTKQQQQEVSQGAAYKAVIGHLKTQGRELVGTLKSLTLSNFSIGMMIAKAVELYNMQRKLSGMAAQTAYHWGGGKENIRIAHAEMNKLRLQFHMSADEAGNLVTDLAKSGIGALALSKSMQKTQSYANVLGVESHRTALVMKKQADLGELIMANEINSGMARGEQAKYIQRIMREENVLSAAGLKVEEARATKQVNAFTVMRGIQATAENIRKSGADVVMEEVVEDIEVMRKSQRDYNTDLLGTIGLYSTLLGKAKGIKGTVGKDLIEGLGSEETRRGIGKTISGMGDSLSDGWKAAIMKSGIKGIFDFESLSDPQKFKAVGKFVQENIGGSIENQLLTARKLLAATGFGTREQKKMADLLVTGEGKGAGLDKLVQGMEKEGEAAAAEMKKQEDERKQAVSSAMVTATKLSSIEKLLSEKFEKLVAPLVPLIEKIFQALMKLIDIVAGAVEFLTGRKLRDSLGVTKVVDVFSGQYKAQKADEYMVQREGIQRKKYEKINESTREFLQSPEIMGAVVPTLLQQTGIGTGITARVEKDITTNPGYQFGLGSKIELAKMMTERDFGSENFAAIQAVANNAKLGGVKAAVELFRNMLDKNQRMDDVMSRVHQDIAEANQVQGKKSSKGSKGNR